MIDLSDARAWAAGFRPFGHEMPAAWYMARAGMSEHVLMDAFERDFATMVGRDEVVRVMRAAFLEEVEDLGEIAHVAGIARDRRGILPMAVASGGSRAIVVRSLAATGLADLFDTVVTIEDVAHPKPAPDLFLEAARWLGVPPERCVVFEDSAEGLEAAHRAGMRGVDVAML